MRIVQLSLAVALLFLATGCGRSGATVLGKAPRGEPVGILSVHAGTTASDVTVSGVMVEKCPTAGCWFQVKDGTGVIRVDTRAAGFVVVDVPLNSKITVAGKVVANGDVMQIEATGIRY